MSDKGNRLVGAVLVLCISLFPLSVMAAADPPPAAKLTMQEAVSLVLKRNRSIQQAVLTIDAAKARRKPTSSS